MTTHRNEHIVSLVKDNFRSIIRAVDIIANYKLQLLDSLAEKPVQEPRVVSVENFLRIYALILSQDSELSEESRELLNSLSIADSES